MTAEPAKPKFANRRCYHFTPTGRRCRSIVLDHGGLYCPRHTDDLPVRAGDFSELLTHQAGCFDAQGIHKSLAMLYHVLASGDISPRHAAVLTYMSSLMLRTLPMIEINLQKRCEEARAQIASVVPGAVIKSSIDRASNSFFIDVQTPQLPAALERRPGSQNSSDANNTSLTRRDAPVRNENLTGASCGADVVPISTEMRTADPSPAETTQVRDDNFLFGAAVRQRLFRSGEEEPAGDMPADEEGEEGDE